MDCAACGHANPERARFCLECGTPFARPCPSCGVELPPGAKFCLECGARTHTGAAARAPSPPPAAEDARKVVTIVFADLVGSTALHERLDPESARRFMESYYAVVREAVESHGGVVTQLLGDGVKAVFGVPRVAEDDALRAVRAAHAMQDAFRALAARQRGAVGATGLRVAVNTGEVVANAGSEVIGDPVNVAARLQEQGRDGDVVVGEATHRLVAARVTLELLGSFALKGRSEAVKAYRLTSLERPAGAATAPFVGRDEELARLAAVYETAVANPAAALAVLLGSPGLGKSRLIDEFVRRHAGAATVVLAHCDAAGAASLAPVAEALRELLGIESGADDDALRAAVESVLPADEGERVAIASGSAALLAGSPASPDETFFAVRRLLAALARARPVVFVIDDLHWAEPLLLDLVEHLIQWGSGVALTVLVGARPELRELRSSLTTPGGLVADVVALAGLDAGAAMQLAANAVGASDLPAAIAARVLATSEGNPLFVGELVRMLVQDGALTRNGDRWTVGANLAAFEMPPTIHALLAARIERLRPDERLVLERASVVGRHFSRGALAELLPGDLRDLDARLEALRGSQLIERDTGWLLGEPVLRFHHVLIRDAAYRRLLKGTRAELHARLAGWIEGKAAGAVEHDEAIGWHLEQAHQLLGELGPLDERGSLLGERAAARLAAAGRRALAADDLPLAAGLLGRALDRLDAEDPARPDLALDWCEALLAAGDVGPAAGAVAELARLASGSPRLRAWHACFAGQLTVLTAPAALSATADAVAGAADELTALGDAAGEAKAHYVHALALARLGRVGGCEAALDRALAAARRAGDRRRANTVLAIAPLAALWGPSPVTRASGRCLDVVRVLRITQGAPAVEAVALSCQGVLEALRGRTDAARRMIAAARSMVEELGITHRLLEVDMFGGLVELLAGDAPAAERSLRGAYEGFRELGLGTDAARAAALLARARLVQGDVAGAEALSQESEALAGDDLKAAIAWRGVRAEALAGAGEPAAAVELASRAVGLAAATDALLDHADARLALAAALRAAGGGPEADAEERRARELWEAKGATLLAERTRAGALFEPGGATPASERAPAPPALRRRVRPNRATAWKARFEAALAARDLHALRASYREDFEELDGPTGSSYGREAAVASVERLLRSRDAALELEPLATLGERLLLFRRRSRAGEAAGRRFDVGPYENEAIQLQEVDSHGVCRRAEAFAADRLAEAICRLYERHAELLPDGRERVRAAMSARAAGIMLGQPDLAATAKVLAPDVEFIDLRTVGIGRIRGASAVVEKIGAMMELSSGDAARIDDLVAAEPGALAVRWTNWGTDRATGGTFERRLHQLFRFGADGRITHWHQLEHEAEALAQLDTPPAAPPTDGAAHSVRANAATRSAERFAGALAARDGEAVDCHLAESLRVVHHPSGLTYGRREMLATWRSALKADRLEFRHERLATLGDTLALFRQVTAVEGLAEAHLRQFGKTEVDEISLIETDGRGRFLHVELFAPDRLDDAVVRLRERHAEARSEPFANQAWRFMQRGWELWAARDWESILAALSPAIRMDDRRRMMRLEIGYDDFVAQFRLLFEQPDSGWRGALLATRGERLSLHRPRFEAEAGEGGGPLAFDQHLGLNELDADGRWVRSVIFDLDDEDAAWAELDARFESGDGSACAGWRALRAVHGAVERRDWDGARAALAPGFTVGDRRRLSFGPALDGAEPFVRSQQSLAELAPDFRYRFDHVRTSDRGYLAQLAQVGTREGGGVFESPFVYVAALGPDGRPERFELWDVEDVEQALARFAALALPPGS